jgi:hypothetical protein
MTGRDIRARGPARLAGVIAAVGVLGVLLLAGGAEPANAGTTPRSVSIAAPARGDVAVLSFTIRAANGRAPGQVAISVTVPQALRSQLGVLAVADNQGTRREFDVYILRRRGARAQAAGPASQRITVRVRGVTREISVSAVQRATDALAGLTAAEARKICTGDVEQARKLLGLRGGGALALAKAIRAVLCDTGDDEDRALLAALGVVVPRDLDEFECIPFPGNVRETTCRFTGQDVNRLRIRGSGGVVFSRCFAGMNSCRLERAGRQNNAAVFTFGMPVDDSGPLNVRSGNQPFRSWDVLLIEASRDGGRTYRLVEGFLP